MPFHLCFNVGAALPVLHIILELCILRWCNIKLYKYNSQTCRIFANYINQLYKWCNYINRCNFETCRILPVVTIIPASPDVMFHCMASSGRWSHVHIIHRPLLFTNNTRDIRLKLLADSRTCNPISNTDHVHSSKQSSTLTGKHTIFRSEDLW